MSAIDWLIFVGFLAYVVWDGSRRARRSHGAEDYFLAGRSVPWWAMGLSIMATQASAITMIGTTGQGMREGMRFLQFYFALPVAMVILCFTLVPLFHRLRVFTAYEYLGHRFDRKTRLLSAGIFLVLRALSAGLVIYAPSVVFATLFGVDQVYTILALGAVAVLYTVVGGMRAVIATDVKQMVVMTAGILVALGVLISRIPEDVGFEGALQVAREAGRLELVDWSWDPSSKYTIPSAMIGGLCLFLAYFGCDQSQVQRHLAGRSLQDKRGALLLNAVLKVPFQFVVLFCGVLLFVFTLFHGQPLTFVQGELEHPPESVAEDVRWLQQHFDYQQRGAAEAARTMLSTSGEERAAAERLYRDALRELDHVRSRHADARREAGVDTQNDVNYAFPSFILAHLPIGIIGLLIAAIFAAALSSVDSELNAMATVAVMDIYRFGLGGSEEQHTTTRVARIATAGLGLLATLFALYGSRLDSVIVAVNRVGSFFYGSLLGVFVLAMGFRSANGHGAFWGLLAGMGTVAVVSTHLEAFLYLNAVGTLTVVVVGLVISWLFGPKKSERSS